MKWAILYAMLIFYRKDLFYYSFVRKRSISLHKIWIQKVWEYIFDDDLHLYFSISVGNLIVVDFYFMHLNTYEKMGFTLKPFQINLFNVYLFVKILYLSEKLYNIT